MGFILGYWVSMFWKKRKKKEEEKKKAMAFTYPSFQGASEENAEDFCDTFELACLLANYSHELMLTAFPLVMKGEARAWYNNISKLIKEDWSLLKKIPWKVCA